MMSVSEEGQSRWGFAVVPERLSCVLRTFSKPVGEELLVALQKGGVFGGEVAALEGVIPAVLLGVVCRVLEKVALRSLTGFVAT